MMFCSFWVIITSVIIQQVAGQKAADSGNSSSCEYNQVKRTNNSCEGCPIGTFGWNCKHKCQTGYFGELCRYRCNCTDQYCNRLDGCKDSVVMATMSFNFGSIVEKTLIVMSSSCMCFTYIGEVIITTFGGCLFLGFCLFNEMYYIMSMHVRNENVRALQNRLKNSLRVRECPQRRPLIQKRKFQPGAITDIINRNTTQSLNAQTPRFQLNYVDSTYDELRYSKMIENMPNGLRGGKMFSEKNSPNVMENLEDTCGRKLLQKNETFQNKAKIKCNCNDYEHCSSENGYSVLSLKFYRSKRNFTRPTFEFVKREKMLPRPSSTAEQYVLLKERGNESGSLTHNNPQNDTLLVQNPPEKKSYLERYSLVKNYICKKEDISIAIPEESYDINNPKPSINANDHTLDVKNLNSDTIASRTCISSNEHLIGREVEDIVMQETNDKTTNNLKDEVLPRPYSLAYL